MDDARRATLLTLIALAEGHNPTVCWDDRRAESLLQSQSNPQELRELGMSEQMIERLFSSEAVPTESVPPPLPRTGSQGRFIVRVEARFEAAHFLREYRGVSEPLHGHSYRVEAELTRQGGGVDSDAIAVDFVTAKRKLEALARRLDYVCINDVPPFDRVNPTAENMAEWFERELTMAVAEECARVRAVTLWEGPVNSVTFRRNPDEDREQAS